MKIRLLIDKILTFICFFVPSYLICHFYINNMAIKIVLSSLISIFGINKSRVNYKNFELYVSVHGAGYIYDKLILLFDDMKFSRKDDFLISPDQIMIVCSAKFGNVSPDEILKYSKLAKTQEAKKCYLIAKELPKNAAITIANFAENIKFIPLKVVFKLLKSQKLLPDKLGIKIGKLNYSSNVFDIIFDKSNVKKFLFVAIILYGFSFLIPFKTYYIVLGSINILLAIICLVRGRSQKYTGKYEIFEKKNK